MNSAANSDGKQRPPRTPLWRAALLGLVFSAVVGVVVLAFSWPSVTLDPADVPIAISGPEKALEPVEDALDAQSDGAFELETVDDRDAAVRAIEKREVYGAIILGPKPEVLTSSAASTATNQLLTTVHQSVRQQAVAAAEAAGDPNAAAVTVPLTDVVPLSDDDPRGAGLTSAALPLVLGGMIGGIAITFTISGAWRRIAGLLVYAAVAGPAITGIMSNWFGVLEGDFSVIAGTFALTLLAMGATIVGFASLFGRAGVAVGPVLFMLIGNPISGAAFPKEFYPQPWGDIGQYFPPGAGATLLKNVVYFPEANLTRPILILSVWAAAGLVLAIIGHFVNRGRPAVEEKPADAEAEPGLVTV